MADRAFIFGAGGHAAAIAALLPHREIIQLPPGRGDGWAMSQSDFFAEPPAAGEADLYIGIGDNAARRAYFDRLKALGLRVATCVAPTAFVARDAVLGEGVVIGAGAVVGARAVLGDNVIVNTLSGVDHDCVLGDDTQVTGGVSFGGGVRVGRRCFFGLKSAIYPKVVIGDDVTVMAGAVVARDLPDAVMAGGAPARVMRRMKAEGSDGR